MSDDNKCAGCGVRLNVGAHTFKLDVATRRLFGEQDPLTDQEWHCACLVRYQGGEVRVLQERYDEQHEQLSDMRAALAEALDGWDAGHRQRGTIRVRGEDGGPDPRSAELRAKFLGGKQ